MPIGVGGFTACSDALSRLLLKAMSEGLWWATVRPDDSSGNPAFAHLGPDAGGKLFTEVAGDYYLPVRSRLGPGQRRQLRLLGWADPVADLSGDDEIQPRNHTRSWEIDQMDDACDLVIITLALVYGVHEDDTLIVDLDPFR